MWLRCLCLLTVLAGVAFASLSARTVGWDVLHYHLYLGFAADGRRLMQDFLPVGPQSYLNPYALWPFFALDSAGVPPLVLAALLGAVQSLNVCLALWLASLLMPGRHGLWLLATALTWANPVFLSEVGTSYTDITTSLPVLVALVVLVKAWPQPSFLAVLLSGVAMGVAFALKMSNGPYALALGLVWPLAFATWRGRVQAGLACLGGGLLGTALAGGVWFWQVWQATGNPVFPAFNNVFQSPLHGVGAMANGTALRFVPTTLWEAFIRPGMMVWPQAEIHTESSLPDARFLAFFLSLVLGGLVVAWRARSRSPQAGHTTTGSPSALVALLAWGTVSWCLWLATSGNGRYLMPMCVVVGVLTVAWWHRVTGGGRWFWYPMLVLTVVQWVQLCLGSALRWDEQVGWGRHWVDVDVPEVLKREPMLLLGTSNNAYSPLLPRLHPDTAMVTINGQITLSPGVPGAQRVQTLLNKHAGHVRVLAPTDADPARGIAPVLSSDVAESVARWGFAIDQQHCDPIVVHVSTTSGKLAGLLRKTLHDMDGRPNDPSGRSADVLLACRLQEAPELRTRFEAEKRDMDRAMDALEAACPKLFRPKSPPTVKLSANYWSRGYSSTDAEMAVSRGRLKYVPYGQQMAFTDAGSVDDWLAGRAPKPDCR
jgi:hypothetical protein